MALLRDIQAFVRRDALEAMRTPGFLATQLVLVITASAAALLMGAHIEPDQPGFLGRPAAFLLTGIMVLDLIWGTTAFSPMRAVDDQTEGMFDACRVTGTPLWRLIVLPQVFPTLLSTARCLVYGLIGSLFIHAPLHAERVPELIAVFLLATASLGCIGIVLRSLALTIGRRLPLGLAFAAVASLCSGLFYPVTALPVIFEQIAHGLPTTWLVEGMRRSLITGDGFAEMADVLGWLGALTIVLVVTAMVTVKGTTHRLLRTDPTGND